MQTETIEINLKKDGNYTIEKTPLSQIAQKSDIENINELNFVKVTNNSTKNKKSHWFILSDNLFEKFLNEPSKFSNRKLTSLKNYSSFNLVSEEDYQSMLNTNKFVSAFAGMPCENNSTIIHSAIDDPIINLNSDKKLRLIKEHFFIPTIHTIQLSKNNFASSGILFNLSKSNWDLQEVFETIKNNENIIIYNENYKIQNKKTLDISSVPFLDFNYYPSNDSLISEFKLHRNPNFEMPIPSKVDQQAINSLQEYPALLFYMMELDIIQHNKKYQNAVNKQAKLKLI